MRHAAEEFHLAVAAYRRMEAVQNGSFEDFDRDWREFLRRVERIYGKAKAACQSHRLWPKANKYYNDLRQTDPLLLYIRQARNAEEHTIANIASDWDPKVRTWQDGDNFHAAWEPWDRPLLPVKSRGAIYDPPRRHLGHDITYLLGNNVEEPIIVGDLALQFYSAFINDLCAQFYPGLR